MPRCFIIQPFDERFTKRFHDIYKPAIEKCGLDAYRVDYDPSVEIPIEAIEQGIRDSSIVLADITIDNPNVWYELGFAYALRRPVIMICSEERTTPRYPFDIQHRTISRYKVESLQDFSNLGKTLTTRINAILEKSAAIAAVSTEEPVALVEGLSQQELAVIAAAASNSTFPSQFISLSSLKNDVERAGFTPMAFSIGIKRLISKKFAEFSEEEDYNGHPHPTLGLTEQAWSWIEANEDKFVIHKAEKNAIDTGFDDIPF